MLRKKKKDNSLKLKWMQQFFSIAGSIAPLATVNILAKLFFTPSKRVLKPAEITLRRKARIFNIEVDEFRNPKNKLKLSCYSWGRGKKTILLAHGWEGRALDYYRIIPALVERGYRVIGFDSPGHGSSEGERSNMVDFKEVMYQLVKNKIGVPYAIIAHSMGAGAAAFMLVEHDIRVEKFVAITIPTVSRKFFENVLSMMKVPDKMQQAFFAGMSEQYGEDIDHYNLVERSEPIKANDMLIIYDAQDEVINPKDTREFLARHPEIKGVEMSGIGHYGLLRNKHVIDLVIDFIDDK
ncbi:MAG: alpha/beta fold hydrolase [Bacteroidetes bacterium]|nr:alpha/beta fold hydrolase [Bacteroidota bacterium]